MSAEALAARFATKVTKTHDLTKLSEAAKLALEAAEGIFLAKGDKVTELHETCDGFVMAGGTHSLLMGNDGRLVGATLKPTAEEKQFIKGLDATAISEEEFRALSAGTTIVTSIVDGLPIATFMKEGKACAMTVTKGGKQHYLKPAGKKTGPGPTKLKQAKKLTKEDVDGIHKSLLKLTESEEIDEQAASVALTEAWMKIVGVDGENKGLMAAGQPAAYANYCGISFRSDNFIDETPSYALAEFVMQRAIKTVCEDQGDKLANAIMVALKADPKVKALDIKLREKVVNESVTDDTDTVSINAALAEAYVERKPVPKTPRTAEYHAEDAGHSYAKREHAKRAKFENGPFMHSANDAHSAFTGASAEYAKVRKEGDAEDVMKHPAFIKAAKEEHKRLEGIHPTEKVKESLNEDDANTYDPAEARKRIAELHASVNDSLSDKLGPDDDATLYLGGKSQRREYEDLRFQLGQMLVRNEDNARGHWVTNPGHQTGGGPAIDEALEESDTSTTFDMEMIKKHLPHAELRKLATEHGGTAPASDDAKFKVDFKKASDNKAFATAARALHSKNATKEDVEEVIKAKKAGLFPGEGNGTVSPYAGKDDDGDDDSTGEDPDEGCAVIVPGEGKLELRKGYDGDGAIIDSVECDLSDQDDLSNGEAYLSQKAQEQGYVYVPQSKNEWYDAMGNVLAEMFRADPTIDSNLIDAYDQAVSEDEPAFALEAAQAIAEAAGKELLASVVEGLTARAHRKGRRHTLTAKHFRMGAIKPKNWSGKLVKEEEETGEDGEGEKETGIPGKKGKVASNKLVQTGPGSKGGFSKTKPDSGMDEGDKKGVTHSNYLNAAQRTGYLRTMADRHEKAGNHKLAATFKKHSDEDHTYFKKHQATFDPNANPVERHPRFKAGVAAANAQKLDESEEDLDPDGVAVNQKKVKKTNTGVRDAKTKGPQNDAGGAGDDDVPASVPEGTTSNASMNLQMACPKCEATQGITVKDGKCSCDNCGTTGSAADFKMPSTVGDTVKEWVESIRRMDDDEFFAEMEQCAKNDLPEDFRAKTQALVEAYKAGPGRRAMARKITHANPIIKRTLGKGLSLEGLDYTTVVITFPRNRLDEFLQFAEDAGAPRDTEVKIEENTVTVTTGRIAAEKVQAVFTGTGISFVPAV